MRFKHVQLSTNLVPGYESNVAATIPGGMSFSNFTGDLGAPLAVGNETCGVFATTVECDWPYGEFRAPTGIPGFNSSYLGDSLTSLDSDLAELGTNSVLTSLDEQNGPGFKYGLFVCSVETDPTVSGGFTMQRTTVTDATLASTVSAMAANGVVVTAASVSSAGGIDLVAYAWTGDSGTIYDARTVLTTYEGVGPQALTLAGQGYIITAVGTADGNQVLLVGTKVHGDTAPRNLHYAGPALSESGGTVAAGEITVGQVFGSDAGNNPNVPGYSTALAQ